MRTITTGIDIQATPTQVWSVLSDFGTYAEWNPHTVAIEGEPIEGATIEATFANGMTVRPTLTVVRAGRSLEWFGRLGPGRLFDGRHRFDLVVIDGGTRLIHSESFTGILVPLLRRLIRQTEHEFAAANEALSRRVRILHAH